MTLKIKIFLGAILGLLWIAFCVFLAFMPEPKEVGFSYYAVLNAQENYAFNMRDNSAKLVHQKINGEESLINTYNGFVEECENGGVFTITSTYSAQITYDLEINTDEVYLSGQKNITAYKTVGDYAVLYLNDRFVCLTNTGFTQYDEVVGFYGNSLKDFKNPNVDVYLKIDETHLKEILINELYAVCSSGKCSSKYFQSADEITEILYKNEKFYPTKAGHYRLQVKTTKGEMFVNAYVYTQSQSPYNNIIQISSKSLEFEKTNHNKVDEFLNFTELKIRFPYEEVFTVVTPLMIEGLDTSEVGRQTFYIKYKDVKYCTQAIIVDPNENCVEKITTKNILVIEKQGESNFLDNLTINIKYLDGTFENNVPVKDNENITLSGYNKNNCLKQIVTINYKNAKTKILIVVLNEEDYNNYINNQ